MHSIIYFNENFNSLHVLLYILTYIIFYYIIMTNGFTKTYLTSEILYTKYIIYVFIYKYCEL